MYIRRVLEEYVRFFHQPDHYPKIENVENFLGSISSSGGFEVLSTAVYKKGYKIVLPKEIEEMIYDNVFEHDLFPEYYNECKNMEKVKIREKSLVTLDENLEIAVNEYPFSQDLPLIFLGEIANMPEHGIFIGNSGKIYKGYHIWNFRELTEDET